MVTGGNTLAVGDSVGPYEVIYARGGCIQLRQQDGKHITIRKSDIGQPTYYGEVIEEVRGYLGDRGFHWDA